MGSCRDRHRQLRISDTASRKPRVCATRAPTRRQTNFCQPLPVQRTSPPTVHAERLAQTKRTRNRSMVSRCGRIAFGPTTTTTLPHPPTLFICCDHDKRVTRFTSCDFPPQPSPLSDPPPTPLTPGSQRWREINETRRHSKLVMTSLLYADQYANGENYHRSVYVGGIDRVSIPDPRWCFSRAARHFSPPPQPSPSPPLN